MHLLATYRPHPTPQHAGDFELHLTHPETGALLHTLSTRTTPRGISLRAEAEAWAAQHHHTLTIDHHSLITEP